MQYYKSRPLGAVNTRYTPIYRNGSWNNLYMVQLHSFVLFVACFIDKPLTLVQPSVDSFATSLMHSKLEIPNEEPPVLLRTFAKRETLAMLYHNVKTGTTLFPNLRAGAEVQQRELLDVFWGFFSDANTALRIPGVAEYSIVKDGYRFYAKSETVHKLYLLLGNESLAESPAVIANEVLKNIKQQ